VKIRQQRQKSRRPSRRRRLIPFRVVFHR
jgi:hypothetical protein